MTTRLFTNNAAGKLNANILAGDTSLTLQAGQGALFPSPTGGDYFTFTIINNSNVLEICKCTSRAGDVFTIVRAQEGTSAIGFTAGDRVELRLTAAGISNKEDRKQVATISGNVTLTGVDAYQEKAVTAAAAIVLPLASDAKLQPGDWIDFKIITGGAVTIAPQGADLLDGVGSGTPYTLSNLDSVRAWLRAAGNWNLNFKPTSVSIPPVCQGRLTLSTGVPVTTADVLAATIVYFTPYAGNRISTFNGSVWNVSTFAEKSVAVPGTTNKPFDVFIVDGTLALETIDWTDDLNRATSIALQDGVYVKSTDHTRRYLGTCRTTGVSGQCEDSIAKRFCWNYYNRKARKLLVAEATDTWSYGTATWRQANGSTANQLDMVIGVSEDPVSANVATSVLAGTGLEFQVGIGLDSTTTPSQDIFPFTMTVNNGGGGNMGGMSAAQYRGYPGAGRHFLAWLEIGSTGATITWLGSHSLGTGFTGGSGVTTHSGIYGELQG